MMNDEELSKRLRILNFIWLAMLASLAFYLLVALLVAKDLKTTMAPETFTILRYALYLLAFITLILTRVVKKLLFSPRGGSKQTLQTDGNPVANPAIQKYSTAMIVIWAMAESVGIYGLVLFFLGKNTNDLYLLILVSAVAMGYYRPKREELLKLISS